MALREIRVDGDEILRKTSKPVKVVDEKIVTLLDDLTETMKAADGLGLAAPQVGVLRRVAVIEVEDQLYELINPEILASGGEQERAEGCLSVPDTRGFVKRPQTVTVKAVNRAGEEFELKAEGVLAIAVCHELDHLDGKLFTDSMTRLVREGEEDDDDE